jgi:hypothetical protein
MSKKTGQDYEVSDHQLSISSLSLLFKLFRKNKVDRKYRRRVSKILLWAILTQPLQWLQKLIIWPQLRLVDYLQEPPTFVIGHWRSGTTHLHYILSRDPQFGYLTNYQALFMRMSFVGKGIMDRILDHFMPETRPQDNITLTAYDPAEEEQPFSNMTECSGMQSWFFPKNQTYFEKYNLFSGTTAREKRRWKRKYRYMLKLISLANKNKPLLLKNPHNTGRIRELLELFPRARFIFIHRHPFDVYLSTRHLYGKVISSQVLQDVPSSVNEANYIHYYQSTMQKYLAERDLIPEGQLIEISFSELESDPSGVIRRIYEALSLPGYEKAKPYISEYLASVSNYKKNKFEDPDPKIQEVLLREWAFAFDEWGYSRSRQPLA